MATMNGCQRPAVQQRVEEVDSHIDITNCKLDDAGAVCDVKLMMGHYELGTTSCGPSLCITTVVGDGQDRCKHHLRGLSKCSGYKYDEWDWEVLRVNEETVLGWTHCVLTDRLQQLQKKEENIHLVLRHVNEESTGAIDIILNIIRDLTEDGSLGEKLRAVYEVTLRMSQKVAASPNIKHVRFDRPHYIRVRHGALKGRYLTASRDSVSMDLTTEPPKHIFRCYTFHGQDQTDGEAVFLCVLQEIAADSYLVPCPKFSPKLRSVQASLLDVHVEQIKTADPRFFCMVQAGQEDDTFFLRPLVYKDFYLCYDVVNNLKLQRCKTPPYAPGNSGDNTSSNFTFEFIQEDDATLAKWIHPAPAQ